ncbi:hypothetical protein BGZ74_010553 [Mortierella antarctica]|nr:hypothetical protein BGZ74_010553 [Mortierella antarctica]
MPPLTSLIVLLVVVLQCIFALPPPAFPSPPPDFTKLTVLETIHPIPEPWVYVEPAPAEQVIAVSIGFKLPNILDFERQFMDISTPGSPTYGQFLSAEQIFALLDPAKDVVDLVITWLKLANIKVTHDHQWLTLELTVGQLNMLLQAQYNVYRHSTTGVTIIRTESYSIPSVLVPAIDVVLPGTSFDGDLSHGPTSAAPTPSEPLAKRFVKRATCNDQVTPSCLHALYGIPTNRATQPKNVIAVPGFVNEFANEADLGTFLAKFRPDLNPRPKFTVQLIDGGQNPQDPDKAGIEANLDIQYTVGLANGAPTNFISSGISNMNGFINMANSLLYQEVPPSVLSISYGFNENQQTERDLHQFRADLPRKLSWVTAVGATKGQPEVGAELSAGGFSNIFPTATYQADAVAGYRSRLGSVNQGRYNPKGRAYPDISAQGVNIAIVLKGAEVLVEGTSASAPIVASIVALLNDKLISKNGKPLGFLNPLLYSHPGIFNDITAGNNPSCGTNGFPATAGWDPVTGLGTPNFPRFAQNIDVV